MWAMRVLFLILLAGCPVGVLAQGRQPPPPANPVPYVTETGKTFTFRSFEDDQGGFYLIWPRLENEKLTLMAQHVSPDEQITWQTPGLPLASVGIEGKWDAAPDSKGGILITWDDAGRVRAQSFDPSGKPRWPEKETAVSRSSFTQSGPIVAPDGSGGAYLVWQEKTANNRWVLMSQHVNAMGAHLWTMQGTRVSLRPSEQLFPVVVPDRAAGAIVAWQDFRENASQLQAQRLNYQGSRLWGQQGIVITAPAGDSKKAPHLAAVGGGAAVLSWQAPSSGVDRSFLQLATADGKLNWGPEGLEVSKGNWHEWNPVLYGDGEGGTWIGWEDYRNQTNWQVFVHHVVIQGPSPWPGGETALTNVSADQGRLSITDDRQGGLQAAWIDNRVGTTGLYLQVVDRQGQLRLGPAGFLVANQLKEPLTPQITGLGPGQAVICWADRPSKGVWNLYWKRLSPTLTPPTTKS
jgi:hypothetical protein